MHPSRDFKSLLDELPGGIILSDSETHALYTNKATEELLKISNADLTKMILHERVHPEDQPTVKQYAVSLKEKKHMVTKRRFKDGDGKYIYMERNTRLLKDGTQLSFCRDITSEEELHQRHNRFVSLAGHELRNPLFGMQIYVDLISALFDKHGAAAEARSLLGHIQEEIKRQAKMIDDFVNISKVERQLCSQMQWFDLVQFISEIIFQIRASTGRTFRFTRSTLDEKAFGDKERLYQVFINLFNNAAKYSKAPSPIEVGLAHDNCLWRISVKDYGIGIKKDDQAVVFNEFSQVEKNSASGLGIGLYLSSEIVKAHRGLLTVESELGKGSTFTVTVPLTP